MKAFWQNIKGARKAVLETALVSIFTLIIYLIAYWISGKVEIATMFALALASFAAAPSAPFAALVAFVALFAALVALVAPSAAAPFVALVVFVALFATSAVLVAFAAESAAREYKTRYWKVLIVYILEAFALFSAMMVFVPYLAIGVFTALCLAAAFLFAEQKLRPRLSADKPQK